MEKEPKKENQKQKTSEDAKLAKESLSKNTAKTSTRDASSTDQSPNKKSTKRFRDFLMGPSLDELELDPSKTFSEKSNEKSHTKKVNDKEKTNGSSDGHEFSFSHEFMSFKSFKYLHSNKKQVIQIIGGIIGVLFIIAGILYEFGASVRLADNVIYGERAVLSVFSILIGILIIATFFGRHLLAGTFLKKIHSELEEVEDKPSKKESSDQKEKSLDGKEKQKDIDEKDKK
ncbi:CvpA family protein [Methanobacterium petrolearium]|uniref:CvpA family protein n=1 Tax=Methanobacterium petrolearium TaxID=710190 RepID=UPI001AE67B2E|nr:CvpA family protein [Methanobacterium petrolearium]MBP1944702.1 hypothetical protein [Methanobacterium petrolearium]BDZ69966.1 hypothetical protein GCM10025861_04830 [Methanobacterium petrolearium]